LGVLGRGFVSDGVGVNIKTLSYEQFSRLCDAWSVPVPSGGEGERRLAGRVEHRAPVEVCEVEGGHAGRAVTSTLRDVSPRGATLCHPKPLKPGTQLLFLLPAGAEGAPQRMLASVAHCKCFNDGTSLVGVEFLGFLSNTVRKAG
jgi:hypothetical protein